jgi:hypothetical protein
MAFEGDTIFLGAVLVSAPRELAKQPKFGFPSFKDPLPISEATSRILERLRSNRLILKCAPESGRENGGAYGLSPPDGVNGLGFRRQNISLEFG